MVTSCSTGVVVPDPLIMKATRAKYETFRRDLKRVHSVASTAEKFFDRAPSTTKSPSKLKYWA